MRKRQVTFEEMIEKNKAELLNDKKSLDKLEERLDQKYATTKN